jgi:hypothetical protein
MTYSWGPTPELLRGEWGAPPEGRDRAGKAPPRISHRKDQAGRLGTKERPKT